MASSGVDPAPQVLTGHIALRTNLPETCETVGSWNALAHLGWDEERLANVAAVEANTLHKRLPGVRDQTANVVPRNFLIFLLETNPRVLTEILRDFARRNVPLGGVGRRR